MPFGNADFTASTLANTSANAPAGSVFNFIFIVIVELLGTSRRHIINIIGLRDRFFNLDVTNAWIKFASAPGYAVLTV